MSRLIGSYPVIGIRPTIDGRRGVLKVRESLEEQTMNMAKNAARLKKICATLTALPSRSSLRIPPSDALAKRRHARINSRERALTLP